jgi:hypothetical protein
MDHIDSEIKRWLELLLQLVKITGPNPELHLRQFLNAREGVLKKYRQVSQKFVSTDKVSRPVDVMYFFSFRLCKLPRMSSLTLAFSSSSNFTSPSESGPIR